MRVHVEAMSDLRRWATGFSIDTPLGQMVLASNTKRLNVTLPAIEKGRASMDYTIESSHFGVGQYFVNANVSEVIDIDTHVLMQGARFTVVGSDVNLGTVAAHLTAR